MIVATMYIVEYLANTHHVDSRYFSPNIQEGDPLGCSFSLIIYKLLKLFLIIDLHN